MEITKMKSPTKHNNSVPISLNYFEIEKDLLLEPDEITDFEKK